MIRLAIFFNYAGWLVAGLLMSNLVHAQRRLSLSEALELGLRNRYDLRADSVSLELIENSIRKNQNNWLPDLNLSGDVRYNTQLQTTIIPAGTFGGSAQTGEQRLAFGTRNSTVFALNLTQPLYRPEARTDLAIVRNNGFLDREKVGQRKTDAKIKIAEAYLNVLLKDLQQGIAVEDQERYRQYYQISRDRYELGTLLEADYLEARVNWENSAYTAATARQDFRLAQSRLCYELQIPLDTAIVLTDQIVAESADTSAAAGNDRAGLVDGSEVRQLRLELQGYRLQEQKVIDALKPTVSFYGNYSAQFLSNSFNYLDNSWFPFNYLGLQLKVPLSGHLTKKTNLLTYRLHARETELRLRQAEADLYNDFVTAETTLSNATLNLKTTRARLDLSRYVASLQMEQYRLGALLYTKLLDTESTLQNAERNYLEAAYEFLIAKLNRDKLSGKY